MNKLRPVLSQFAILEVCNLVIMFEHRPVLLETNKLNLSYRYSLSSLSGMLSVWIRFDLIFYLDFLCCLSLCQLGRGNFSAFPSRLKKIPGCLISSSKSI